MCVCVNGVAQVIPNMYILHALVFIVLGPEPKLLRGVLELTVVRGDLEFLKYLVSNHSVDVDGEHS